MGYSVISSYLDSVCGYSGLGKEQVSFVSCMIMAFVGAYLFRKYFNPRKVSVPIRLLVSGLFGLWLLYFGWGWKVLLPLLDTVITYFFMKYLDPHYSHKITFIFSMLFLCGCHTAQLYSYHTFHKRYSADFTGPIMILTQRITTLAFSVHDGMQKKENNLLRDQKRYSVKKLPTFLEYFSYMFAFNSVMAGPLVFYQDYMSYIKGTNYKSDKNEEKTAHNEPSSFSAVVQKVLTGLLMACVFVYGAKYFPYLRNIDEEFMETESWFYRICYLYVSLFICRSKYYFAWSLADAVGNTAGLGFNGYDENGKPKWNLVSNIYICSIEGATSLKVYIDNWNIMTTRWLRMVCYDRISPKYRMLCTFFLSAIWHGFFPGYYMTFISGHMFTLSQRVIRRTIRASFQKNDLLSRVYEVITWFFTQLSIAYIVMPFVALELNGSLRFYRSCYFCGHIICLLIICLNYTRESKKVLASNGHTISKAEFLDPEFKHKHVSNGNSSTNGHLEYKEWYPVK